MVCGGIRKMNKNHHKGEKVKLSDLKANDNVEGISVLIESLSVQKTKSGKDYLNMSVRDQDSSVNAKLWDYIPEKHSHVRVGSVINIWATVDFYQGNPQLNVKQLETSLEDPLIFAKKSRFAVDCMWNDLLNRVNNMSEPLTKYITEEILLAIAEQYKKAPAAKDIHNAWFGGLLEHSLAMADFAAIVVTHYKHYCEKISLDKVMFGCIIHDAAKIIEFDLTNPSFNYTPISLFTNHLVMAPAWVYEKANAYYRDHKEMDQDLFKLERAHLMHIVAAHHGQPEWGSPMCPASVEAGIVHYLDYLDSQTMHLIQMATGKPGPIKGFSERSYAAKTHIYQY
jgi:3'-5' exoribonuclease